MEFSGKLLKRGFWLYIWDIKQDRRRHLYVGRTRDTSSPHASSPFRRIGQHLDTRLNAKGNALGRQLKSAGINPETCVFEMTAIGPIFDEQETMPNHIPFRDETAALERALADELKRRGYEVLGTHPKAKEPNPKLLSQVIEGLQSWFPPKDESNSPRHYSPIKLRGGEPIHITVMRGRGHGSEHPQIAEWEASQRQSQGTTTEEPPSESILPRAES
jgi:hypothetical protein